MSEFNMTEILAAFVRISCWTTAISALFYGGLLASYMRVVSSTFEEAEKTFIEDLSAYVRRKLRLRLLTSWIAIHVICVVIFVFICSFCSVVCYAPGQLGGNGASIFFALFADILLSSIGLVYYSRIAVLTLFTLASREGRTTQIAKDFRKLAEEKNETTAKSRL